MTCNVHPLDAALRSAAGVFLVASPLLNFATYPYNLAGLVLVASGVASFCPVYAVLRALLPRSRSRQQLVAKHG
jgi:hypothetical protein